MMSEKKQNLKEALFDLAVQKTTAAERAAFLEGACRDNPELRAWLDLMLEGYFSGAGFLTRLPSREEAATQDAAAPLGTAAQTIGRYKLLEMIGEGGFGEVWMAEQREPVKRRVALKVIKLGMDSRQIVARFEAERQALAMMDHPHIARIFDAGTTDTGRPYFVMELVRGLKITEYCDQNQLPTHDRLKLFIQVCQAIQHAHQKGIIHRDIKPSNVLVTLHDGIPVPKVIDFGIAKATQQELTDKTVFTQFQQFIGTPAYISPEQAEMSGLDIDTRADIYSLGVLLYELLVGQTPFDTKDMLKGGLDALRQIIREREPQRPSTKLNTMPGEARTTAGKRRQTDVSKLVHQLQGDLDWVVMKCLDKDRTRRYDTANGLAMDIQRYLGCEPVLARPPSRLYEFQKTVRRHKVGFAATAAIILLLAVGVTMTSWQAVRATRARQVAEQARSAELEQRLLAQTKQKEAQEQRQVVQTKQQEAEKERQRAEASEARTSDLFYGANMNLVQAAFKENNFARTRQLLEQADTQPRRGFEWYYWQRQLHREAMLLRGHVGGVLSVAFSPDGRRLATGGRDGWVILWDTANGEEGLRFQPYRQPEGIGLVAFSPDGQSILSDSGRYDPGARIHNAVTGAEQLTLSRVRGGSFSPDGRRIGTLRGEKVIIWDSATGQELLSFKVSTPFSDRFGQTVTFCPDGKSILAAYSGPLGNTLANTEGLWDAATGERKLSIPARAQLDAISPDGQRIVTLTRWGGNPVIWDMAHPDQPVGTLVGQLGDKQCVKFSPNGKQLLTAGEDQTARLWDATTLKELRAFGGHTAGINQVAFSPDGRLIATASEDGTARIWDLRVPDGPLVLRDPGLKEPQDAAVSPDGRWVASAHNTNAVIWEAATGKLVHRLTVYTRNPDRRPEWAEDSVNTVCFSPDSTRLVASGNNYVAILFDVKTGQKLATLEHPAANSGERAVRSAAFSPDGQRILTVAADITTSANVVGPLKLWDAATGQFLKTITENVETIPLAWGAIFSPDGRRIIATGQTAAGVWDANSGKFLFPLPGGGSGCCRKRPLAVSPDGRFLATALGDLSVQVWDAATGQPLIALHGHRAAVTSASFSPDGERLVTSGDDGMAKIWNARTGQELLTLEGHVSSVRSAHFFPDGDRILTCSYDGTVRIWDAATPRQMAAWQHETKTGEKLLAARKADLEERERAWKEERAREDTAGAKARADAAALSADPARQARDPGAIKQWLVLAPLRVEGRDSGMRLEEKHLPNEGGLRPHPGERIKVVGNYDGVEDFVWTAVRQNDYRIDLKKIVNFPIETSIGYMVTYVLSDEDRNGLLMKVGSDYNAKLYLNGRVVYESRNPKTFEADRDKVEGVQLKAGLNVLVFKIVQASPHGWGGSVWITEADGQAVKGIKVTLDPKTVE